MSTHLRSLSSASALILYVALSAACAPTETGNPVAPVDPERIHLREGGNGELLVVGSSGAVPEAAGLVATNLERAEAPVRAVAEVDGSFDLRLGGVPGDAIRLAVEHEAITVVDLSATPMGETAVLTPFLGDCMAVLDEEGAEIQRLLDVGGLVLSRTEVVQLTVRNDCAATITVEGVTVRDGSQGVDVMGAVRTDVPSGASADALISVEVTADVAGEVRDVVRIGFDGGRRSITVVGRGRAAPGADCSFLDEAGCDTRADCEWVTMPGFPGPISMCQELGM